MRQARRDKALAMLVALLLAFVCCAGSARVAWAEDSASSEVATDSTSDDSSSSSSDSSSGGSPWSSSKSEKKAWELDTSEVVDTAGEIYGMAQTGVVAFAVVSAAALIVGVVTFVRKPKAAQGGSTRKAPSKAPAIAGGALAVVCVAGIVSAQVLAFSAYKNSINALFTQTKGTDSNITTTAEDWQGLAAQIGREGTILLRNEDSTLPLAKNTKINLLGQHAYDPVYSGSGSGSTGTDGAIDFVTSLESAGFEVNPALAASGIYNVEGTETSGVKGGGKGGKGMGFMTASFSIDEPAIDVYEGETSFESMSAYSDTAVVVIGRKGGEGGDLTSYEGTGDGRTFLQLSKNEEDLVKRARDAFKTVIVVYNGVNTMEMGWLEDYADAALCVGIPGKYGLKALGGILTGDINPSGRTVDTWAYDLTSNPASENYGEQQASNVEDYYVDYVEGIYVGYKWYETAYAEGAQITNTKTGTACDYASDYDSIVQYPFGYGLSYTTFDQKIVGGTSGSVDAHDEVTVRIEVTNTGDVAGMDAVQLYLTSPYTDYDKANGVEKAAVQLIAVSKTKLLEPGESQEIVLSFSAEDMAAYDASYANSDGTTGAYMLDAGDYVLSVRENAHVELDSTTLTVARQFFYSGADKRDSDEAAASNLTDAARGTYLSRADGFANYAEAMASVSSEVDASFSDDPSAYDAAFDDAVTKEYVEGVDYGVKGDLTLADLRGLSFDDEKWDELVSQLTLDELASIPSGFMFGTPAIESISKDSSSESDGPMGVSSMFSKASNTAYPSIPVLTATFNPELAHTYGSYIADEAHTVGTSGWYAPAMDIHRWAYSGRNFEYYSEDGRLSAIMAGNETRGARDKGLIVYLKHFFLNDQETHRAGRLHTYSNEQAIREIYLAPFEASIKDGNATAIMNSMNYVGDEWIGVIGSIQNGIVRGEWGFDGRILTDMSEGEYMMSSGASAIRNGTDVWLVMGDGLKISNNDELSNADIYYLQNVAHNVLFAEANAQVTSSNVLPWQPLVRAVQISLGAIAVAGALVAVKKLRKQAEMA